MDFKFKKDPNIVMIEVSLELFMQLKRIAPFVPYYEVWWVTRESIEGYIEVCISAEIADFLREILESVDKQINDFVFMHPTMEEMLKKDS